MFSLYYGTAFYAIFATPSTSLRRAVRIVPLPWQSHSSAVCWITTVSTGSPRTVFGQLNMGSEKFQKQTGHTDILMNTRTCV